MTTATQPTEEQLRVTPEFLKSLKSTVRLPSSKCMSRALVVRRDRAGLFTVEVCLTTYAPEGSQTYSHDDRFVWAATGSVENYGPAFEGRSCVASQSHSPFRGGAIDTLASLANIVKVGDKFHVKFVISNSSENTKSVGWVRDEAYLTVIRGVKPLATFTVDVFVGPDNSARMLTSF